MSSLGYLNIVDAGAISRCFFIGKGDATCAVRVNDGEPVKIETKEQIIESKLEKKNERWFITGYESLNVNGLLVEIEI